MGQGSLQVKSSKFTKAREDWQKRNIDEELNLIKRNFERNTPLNLYNYVYSRYSWIYKTIIDKSIKYKLESAEKILLIGSGMYPYSLLDMHRRFPGIKYYGMEINEARAKLSKLVVSKTPAKDDIVIIQSDANTYDFKEFSVDDLIFISCDVDSKDVIAQIVKTSGAQFWICAPYEKMWTKNLLDK
jgi:hypothetical protein